MSLPHKLDGISFDSFQQIFLFYRLGKMGGASGLKAFLTVVTGA